MHPLHIVLPSLFDGLAAPVYCSLLWVTLLFVREPRVHGRILLHLFTVSVLSALHEYLCVIGPSLILTGKHHNLQRAEIYSLSLTILVIIAVGTTRTGPEVFRERHRLYTPAVTNKLEEVGGSVGPNVIGSGESIIGSFLSISTLKLMTQVSACEQIDVHELPVLPASMQTEPTTIAIKPRSNSVDSRLGVIISLLLEIVRPNRVLYLKRESFAFVPLLLLTSSDLGCTIVEVLLAYVPHFCLQQILLILDQDASRRGALAYSGLWIVAWEAETIARITRVYD